MYQVSNLHSTIMEHLYLANTNVSTLPSEHEEPKPEGSPDSIERVSRVNTQGGLLPVFPVELGGVEQLDEVSGYEHTAYNFSKGKKWWILSVVALCQTSMNFVSVPVPVCDTAC